MKGSIMPRKFRSIRDTSGSHHKRNKSSEPSHKLRPVSADMFFSMFKSESSKQAQKEKEEEERENAKVEEISNRLATQNSDDISKDHIRATLNSKFAAGDVDKAVELLRLQQKAYSGIVQPYNPNTQMLGAENRNNVTCYLDALLFAMFSKLEAFECMLKGDGGDDNQKKLAGLIRLWVSMLRSGYLIRTDMTQNIQDALAACGWADAKLLEQQDTSEAFAFITETLQLPLLTLQVDLFHQGKGDKDDHKVVFERLLNLAVPPDPDGKGIKLEDCLEEYFNTKVDVLRDSLEEKGSVTDAPLLSPEKTIRLVTEDEASEAADQVSQSPLPLEGASMQRRWTSNTSNESPDTPSSSSRPLPRHRSTSIIQRIVVDEDGKPTEQDSGSLMQKARKTGSNVVKAVTIPAWQFFRLIPWHSTSNIEPKSDIDVARQFLKKPVVGICLKRYMMTEKGVPVRQNTYIDIPDSLRLPHFMMVNDVPVEQETLGLSSEWKLVLQSVVCHRGDSLHSGHYVAFARVAPKLLTDNRKQESDPPPDYEEAQWVKFDDLLLESRVSYVDDIKQALREEMPYLLFYQILPMVDVTTASVDGSVTTEPPAYENPAIPAPAQSQQPTTPLVEKQRPDGATDYFGSATTLAQGSSQAPSIRFSSEMDRSQRVSFDDEAGNAAPGNLKLPDGSRRGSVAFSESTLVTPAVTPDGAPSPLGPTTPNEESTAARLSRAAARFKAGGKGATRPSSQPGEGRISVTMSRLGGLMRQGKDSQGDNGAVDGVAADESTAVGAENGAAVPAEEREHRAHHHHLSGKKDRGKSKNRGEKDKEKIKSKSGVPERECTVM